MTISRSKPETDAAGGPGGASRRCVVTSGFSLALMAALPSRAPAVSSAATLKASPQASGDKTMSSDFVTTGEDDQIVPIADAALIGIKLLKKGTLKTYPGLPHGMCTTHPEVRD